MSSSGSIVQHESLLVLSDVHLGSDLSGSAPKRSPSIDRDLVRLIEHYRAQKPAGKRWRFVIAGDFIDFIGMTIPADTTEVETPPTQEERAHGLGSAEDHARVKMRLVAERHADVFGALGRFVAAGHAITFVHGNHDVELHWQAVREELSQVLLRHRVPIEDETAFLSRIEHAEWFYYVDDVIYVEHGHQYDPFCAMEHIMAPLSPSLPGRLARGFCDVFLRYVVKPTPGLTEHGHEKKGVFDYLALGARLGLRGTVDVGLRFVRAILELFRLRREHFSEAARALAREHERRIALLAEAKRIGVGRLRALLALQAPPITKSIRGILASVLLDRIALGLAASLALVILALVGLRAGYFALSAALVLGAWVLTHRYLAKQRHVCPAEQLAERASHLAQIFPAAFVVMGHTHVPQRVPVQEGAATYVNLGSWSEDEGDDEHYAKAARTHLVIHPKPTGPSGELLTWDSITGPRRLA